MAGIESFLIFAVTALDLAVVPRRIRTNQFVPDIQLGSRSFKQRRQIALTVGKRLVNSKPLSV